MPGSYVVHIPATQFQVGGPLVGYVSSFGNGNDETSDQDLDENGIDQINLPTTGISSTVYVLTPNTERTGEDRSNYTGVLDDDNVNFTADLGFVELVALGNIVWLDTGVGGGVANNGRQDGAEPGVANVTVVLYQAGSPAPLLTTTTNATGRYQFDNLMPGSYVVHIPATQFQAGGPLVGHVSSTGNGNDETSDQDVDENGIDQPSPPTTGISSTVYVLAPNTERMGEDQSNYTGSLDDDNVNFTADFGFYLVSDMALVKDVTPGAVVRQMPFTYTIRITNTGQMTFTTLVLTDTLPPDFYYTPGSGIPTPDVIAGNVATGLTLFWNLGSLAPGASINVIFGVTATPGITGTYVNVATAIATTPGSVLTRTDDAPVSLQDPRLTLVKQLVSADQDDVAPNYVTFTIAITNVGVSVVEELPMLDQYDTYYLSFAWADVMPDEPADDGTLTWYDLTAPPPSGYNGFGYNLAPGEGFHVTTVFSVVHDITSTVTVNTAVITGATDVHHNPTNRPTDTVPITYAIPTAVELLYFRVDRVSGQQVRLAWATAVEIDNLGFNLYRANVNDPSRASLIHFEPAAVMGGRLGATYVYTDTVPSDGVWWYWLADVDTGGVETRSMQAGVRAEVNAALRYRVYLPVVFKRP